LELQERLIHRRSSSVEGPFCTPWDEHGGCISEPAEIQVPERRQLDGVRQSHGRSLGPRAQGSTGATTTKASISRAVSRLLLGGELVEQPLTVGVDEHILGDWRPSPATGTPGARGPGPGWEWLSARQ